MLTADKPVRRYPWSYLKTCAEREVHWRRRVYPGRVSTGRLSARKADEEIDMMQAIAEHFAELAKGERLL